MRPLTPQCVSMQPQSPLGFGDLCRYFYKALREDFEDYTAHEVATHMVECWKNNKYLYSELEEMFLVNMQHNQDKELLARELGNSLGDDSSGFPEGVSCTRLVNLTIDFFNNEPSVTRKLMQYREKVNQQLQPQRIVISNSARRNRSPSPSMDVQLRPRKKVSKFDSLKPISNYLETLLVSHGLTQHQADLVVFDVVERFVTAGFGWDKVLQYHAKGEEMFIKKLIPHVFMSKDEFPASITPEMILKNTFDFIEDWKSKLYDMMSFNTSSLKRNKVEAVTIKQEKTDETPPQETTQNIMKRNKIDFKHEQLRNPAPPGEKNTDCLSPHSLAYNVEGDSSQGRDQVWEREKIKKEKREIEHPKIRHHKEGQKPLQNLNFKRSSPSQDSTSPSVSPDRKKATDLFGDIQRGKVKKESGKQVGYGSTDKHTVGSYDKEIENILIKSKKRYYEEEHKDIDARIENVPQSYFSQSGVEDKEDFVSVNDGKTTVYHYKDDTTEKVILESKISLKDKNKKLKLSKLDEKDYLDNSKDLSRNAFGTKIEKEVASKKKIADNQKLIKENDSADGINNKECNQSIKKVSLLEKVNEIIKSCVMLKDDKKNTASSLNDLNENEKKLKKIKGNKEIAANKDDKHLEDGEIIDSDLENSEGDKTNNRTVTIVKTKGGHKSYNNKECARRNERMPSTDIYCNRSESGSFRTRSWSRERSNSRSCSERSTSKERSNTRKRNSSPRYCRSRTHSNPRNRRQSRSRSPEIKRGSQHWVPVAPCKIQENVTMEKCSTMMVTVAAKREFSFKENQGCMVRITKWTGKDSVGCIQIKPQIVTLDESLDLQIEVENPYPERTINLKKHENIACLSILSSPIPSGMFSAIGRSTGDRYESGSKRWFKVTSLVLHKKGTLGRITIQPGRTLNVIATVTGPMKKYVGKEVLVSQIKDGNECPIKPQIRRIGENDCLGFDVTNNGRDTLVIEKASQEVACLSVWATVSMEENVRI